MVKQRYGIEVAELILKRYCGDWVDFTGDGVFVKKELVDSPDTSQVFAWTPACEMDWDDAPDPLTHPAIPANFSSQELAAFLLDGVGAGMVASEYGDFSDGPDKEALNALGIRGAKARRVLQDTYENLRAAMGIVGYQDMALLHQSGAIIDQYQDARGAALEREKVLEPNHAGLPESEYMEEYRRRLKVAVAPLENLEREMERITANADISWKRWRHAMVAELLKPATDAAEPDVESAPQVAPDNAPLPVHRKSRAGWKDGPAFDYVAQHFSQYGPFQAKALIASLKKNTGPESPFEVRDRVLTVRVTRQALQDKTIENAMVTIRDRAKKLRTLQG